MQNTHKEILTKEQIKLLPLVTQFSKDFGLVGGTAVALQIGHRRSIDFDMFSEKKFDNRSLLNKIRAYKKPDEIIVNKSGELTLTITKVKFTFYRYSYTIPYSVRLDYSIRMPDLLTLAAMKAFALGQRAKWKDYVDLYFIIKDHHPVAEISRHGKKLFGNEFNEKLFRTQLGFFDDVSYAEEVEFLPGFEVSDKIVKKKLTDFSLEE